MADTYPPHAAHTHPHTHTVDKHDELRLQVVTPDKDTLYLRAGDKTEKQRWVVALASAKLEDHQVDAPGELTSNL